MTSPTYPPCTACGAPCAPVASKWTTPPWYCAACNRSWWEAELTATARAAWRPTRQDFRPPLGDALRKEIEVACQRGVSVHEAMVPLITPAQAASLLGLRIAQPVAAAIAAQAKG